MGPPTLRDVTSDHPHPPSLARSDKGPKVHLGKRSESREERAPFVRILLCTHSSAHSQPSCPPRRRENTVDAGAVAKRGRRSAFAWSVLGALCCQRQRPQKQQDGLFVRTRRVESVESTSRLIASPTAGQARLGGHPTACPQQVQVPSQASLVLSVGFRRQIGQVRSNPRHSTSLLTVLAIRCDPFSLAPACLRRYGVLGRTSLGGSGWDL